MMNKHGFTLFEILLALAIFALAVTGLAIALDSIVGAALQARERALARIEIESRLAAAMIDPPLNGKRVIEAKDNKGVRVEEMLEPYVVKTLDDKIVSGLWKLKIVATWEVRREKGVETADILLYRK